ncbi:DUF397 domain-containing protein [Actinomadura flavalba]|uniref:DUF397 domain-containing protein n=1 Tax=Actinomadura flavalba TaxID=1120938 RepID=UPI00036A6EBF|nr:DUF397 domain-containing protein [Actinomadura flavalba]
MNANDLTWRKATRSLSNGGECIEVAITPATIAVRDSKNPNGPNLLVTRESFRHFADTIKSL